MLARRIIACLDVRDGQVVKGVKFEGLRSAGEPAALARRYNEEGIDELVILDVTATIEKRRALAATVGAVARELFIPLSVGGGIKDEGDAAAAIDAGADKVSLNTAAAGRSGSDHAAREQVRQPGRDCRHRREARGQRLRGLLAQRHDRRRARRGGVGARGRIARRRRNPAHVDRSRRHEGRVRLRDDCRGLGRREHPGDRLRRRRHFDHFVDVFTAGRADAALAASIFHYSEHAVADLKAASPGARHPDASDLTDPVNPVDPIDRDRAIDLTDLTDLTDPFYAHSLHRPPRNGKVVQLVQGERLALEDADLDAWIRRFASFPKLQLIDLDAAIGTGSNDALVRYVCAARPCRVGGGIRTLGRALDVLAAGATHVIVGSSLFRDGQPDLEFADMLARELGAERVIAAIDAKGGRVAVKGWRETVPLSAADAARALEPYCSEFLYTHVDKEGLMQGTDMGAIRAVRDATSRRVVAAGGITTQEEIDELEADGRRRRRGDGDLHGAVEDLTAQLAGRAFAGERKRARLQSRHEAN